MYPTWQNSPRAASSYLPTSSTPATSDPSTAHSHGVVWVADYPGAIGGHAGQAYGVKRTGDARAMGSASFASQDGTLSHSGLLAGYGHGQGRDQMERTWQAERQQQAGATHSISYPPTSASFIPYDMHDTPSHQFAPPVSTPSYGDGYAMPTAPHPSWPHQSQPKVAAGTYPSTPASSGQYADDHGTRLQQSSKRPRTEEGPPRDIRWHLQNGAIPSLEITTSLPSTTAGVPQPVPVRQRLPSHGSGGSGGLKPSPVASSADISPVSTMSSGPSTASASGLPAYEPRPSLTTSDKTSPATFVLPLPCSDETPATSLPPSTSSSASAPSADSASLAVPPQIHPAQVPSPQPAQAKADKSCAPCRARKVRCTRTWPKCARCVERRLDCGYGGLVPIDVVKQMHPESRVLELEARIKSLECELANAQSHTPVSPGSGFNGLALASDLPFEIYNRLFGHAQVAHSLAGPSALCSLDEEKDVVETAMGRAHVEAVCSAVRRRAADAKGLPKLEEGEANSKATWWRSTVARDAEVIDEVAALGVLERRGSADWVRWVIWAILDAFWATCSSNVPTFRPFHPPARKLHFYLSLSSLTACEGAVLAAFLSIGIRSTNDVALLGISSELSPAEEGRKREELARAMRTLMYELYERSEVGFGEGSEAGLQTGLVVGVVSMWNELLPRRTRSIVRTSLGVYKDLFDSAPTNEARQSLQMMYTLPLLHQDSTVAAYLRSSPLISDQDLTTYFPASPVPVFGRAEEEQPVLLHELGKWLDLDRLGGATHLQHMLGSMVIYRWLSACLRWCAEMSCSKGASRQLPVASVDYLLSTLSSLHSYIQTLQHHLTHLAPASAAHPSCLGPDGDTCQDVHLRWATRLDREIDDATWLAFSVVGERLVREDQRLAKDEMEDGEGGHAETWHEDLDIETLKMCETRVRKGLKLAAFYFNFFANSPDPHQTHHLAWSLELIPSWTFLATQRYVSHSASSAEPDLLALRDKATELTERELDWIERGLDLAQRYHPVAERRLNELRMYREANQKRIGPRAVVAAPTVQVGEKERSFRAAMKAAIKQAVPAWA